MEFIVIWKRLLVRELSSGKHMGLPLRCIG